MCACLGGEQLFLKKGILVFYFLSKIIFDQKSAEENEVGFKLKDKIFNSKIYMLFYQKKID